MRFLFFLLFNCTVCKEKIVNSYEELTKTIANEKNTLFVIDLIDTFFFNSNEDLRYESLGKTRQILKEKGQKRADFDKETYENDQKIYLFLEFLKKNQLHYLAVSDKKFFSNIKFQNMLIDHKLYINNILFYNRKKNLISFVNRLARQYGKIIFITRKENYFQDLSLNKPYSVIVYKTILSI